jgi:hypothetical protein
MKNIKQFNNKEALLIISGIASDSTTKAKPQLESSSYLPIFERYENNFLENNGIDTLNYSQLATVVWAYSTLKVDVTTRPQFWAAVMTQLEAQCQ